HRRQLAREGWSGLARLAGNLIQAEGSRPADANPVLEDLAEKSRRTNATSLERTQSGVSQVHQWLRHYAVGSSATTSLESLLKLCQQQGMQAVLIAPPVTQAHRQAYTPQIDAAFLAHVHQLAETYHCPFVDYRKEVPDRMFLDNHHLLAEGGVYFSKRLARE